MAYVAPTLAELRVKVARDLRDPSLGVFLPAQVDDFINESVAEINRVRPVERREEFAGDALLTDLDLDYVFMVEFALQWQPGDPIGWGTLSPDEAEFGYGRNGWSFFGKALLLSPQISANIAKAVEQYTAAQVHLAVWGYGSRDLLLDDADVANFIDAQDEMAVRRFSRLTGLRALGNDRALYQQWQQQANNSDISETQLNAMVNTTEQEWDRLRRSLYTVRRPAVG